MFFINRLILIVYFFSNLIHCFDNNDYCEPIFCGGNKTHVMCKYQSPVPAPMCSCHRRIIGERDKMLVLNKINERRNRIASGDVRSLPSAQNMRKLAWSEELAMFAQRWADQCITRHTLGAQDECRDLKGGVLVGQNVATVYGESPGLNAIALVDMWYSELLNTKASVIGNFTPSGETNSKHFEYFTQLVWAKTRQVGCGGVKFQEIEDRANHTVYRLVCNFAPAGNRKGEKVYESGPPCSRCLGDDTCDSAYSALCSRLNDDGDSNEDETLQNGKLGTKEKNMSFSSADVTENDDYIPFSFLSLLNEFKPTAKLTTQTSSIRTCQNEKAIDELVDLLRKKISNELFLKDLFSSPKTTEANESNFTDAGVFKFMSEIYYKKYPTTPSIITENENENSTLLAELVGAVIFRNGGGDKLTLPRFPEEAQTHSPVNPIRIQAASAKTEARNEFSGHYFFPEDVSEDDSEAEPSTELGESYYDTEIPVSDVISELENFKRTYRTKGFLDEILESDLVDDDNTPPEETMETRNPYEHLTQYMTTETGKTSTDEDSMPAQGRRRRRYHASGRRKECSPKIHYNDFLKRLSVDIDKLQLYQRIHCSQAVNSGSVFIILVLICIIRINNNNC